MSENNPVVSATLENFMESVIIPSREMPVLIDFWASWCAPCKMLMPMIEKLAVEYQGRLKVVAVNADENPELTQQAGVRSLPSVLLVRDGKVIDQFNEALPESQVRAFLDKHVPNFYDPLIAAAAQQLAAGDGAGALHYAEQALQAAPQDYFPAVEVYVQCLIALQRLTQARQVLNALPYAVRMQQAAQALFAEVDMAEQSADLGEINALRETFAADPSEEHGIALALALSQQHKAPEAFNLLAELILQQPQRKECAAYKCMLELLQVVKDPVVVNQARRKLYQLLY